MKKLIILAFICANFLAKAQQEPQFTLNQFNSQLEINPAYAGANINSSISLRSRKQWVGFTGSPSTFNFNLEGKLINKQLAAGLTLIRDRIGIIQSNSLGISLSSHLIVSEEGTLALGIKMGVNFMKSDFSMLTNVDPSDPLYNTKNITSPFVGFGALYYTEKLYIGFAIPDVKSFENVSPRLKVYKPHYYLYGGYKIFLNSDIDIRPALLGKYVSAAPIVIDAAMDVWYKNQFGFGFSYRTMDAINVMIKGQFHNFYLGYSYDMTVSKLRTLNSGTHEILLGFSFGKNSIPDRNQNSRYFK